MKLAQKLSQARFAGPTCKLSDVNPVDYMAAALRAILDDHLQSRIEDLMPWRFNQPSGVVA